MGLRDIAGFAIEGFDPRLPLSSTLKSAYRSVQQPAEVIFGEREADQKFWVNLLRDTAPFVGIPGTYQLARSVQGMSDENQNPIAAHLEGKNRNK